MTAMGRRRGGRFSDRPSNVEITLIGDVTYFRYVMPDGQRRPIGNSRDAKAAYDVATALNGHFAQQRAGLDLAALTKPSTTRATPSNPTIPTLITEFKQHDPNRPAYAENTLDEIDIKLALYEKLWPLDTVADMTTLKVAQFLNTLTNNAYVKHRALLLRLFQFAGHQGYITINPAAVTLVKRESDKVRGRHTWEGFKQIIDFKETPDWLRRAMLVAVYSLQRREDLVLLHKVHNKIDTKAGTITILQRKTRNYKNPVWLEIVMGQQLRESVDACLGSDLLCPYLVHAEPKRMSEKIREAKPHHFAVTPDFLTKGFTKYRDKAGAYADLPAEQRPTFHELRGFGMHLYEQAGYPKEYIMALSGHGTEAMYYRYTKDHKQAGPKRVEAGLSVGQLPT